MAGPFADVLSSKVLEGRGVQGARGSVDEGHDIERVVRRGRGRLTYLALREAVTTHTGVLVGVAAACAAIRPFAWARGDAAQWVMPARASVLALMGVAVAAAVLSVRAFRRRPSLLAAARSLDAALGLKEVIASGFAFEVAGRSEPLVVVARARAGATLSGIDVARVLVPASRTPMRGRVRALLACALLAGLGIGSLDAAALDRLRHPLTAREVAAADALLAEAKAAREAKVAEPGDPQVTLSEAARRAADAAKRGDRQRALEALDDVRAAKRAADAEARERKNELRALREELEASRGGAGAGDARPSESIQKMRDAAAQPSGGTSEALRALAERLARAERAAAGQASRLAARASERAGSPSAARDAARASAWSRVADALREARDAAARGDAAAMKAALERAEEAMREMERAASGASSSSGREGAGDERSARISREAAALDRSLRAGMRGESGARGEGNEGEGEGDGDGAGQRPGEGKRAAKGGAAAKGAGGRGTGQDGDGDGSPTEGPGRGDRTPGAAGRRIAVSGSLEARGDARPGERAVSAIQGFGRGDDGRAFRDVFPSYESAVEDGLKDERVPAARRGAVRRYFSAIRPGDAPDESGDKRP